MKVAILGLVTVACLLAAPLACAEGPTPDYARPEAWLCHPGKPDACRPELASVLGADGEATPEAKVKRPQPSIDCFYVYPTVSDEPTPSASGRESEAERRAARRQVARLGEVCRLHAPLYRQVTAWQMKENIAGRKISGQDMTKARALAEADLLAAWRAYLANDNGGRGVVLVGHSQGANLLLNLIRREIEGRPEQGRLVSAVLPGSFVLAPAGKDVGGTFASIPACRATGQVGCVIVFNAYRASAPPPGAPTFDNGMKPLCVNLAALAGGKGGLKPYLSTRGETIIPDFTEPLGPLAQPPPRILTPVVALPGLFEAECMDGERGVYLSVSTNPAPGDRRTGALVGDWTVDGARDPSMGLHLVDLDLTQGNLIEVIAAQAKAWTARR